MNSVFRISDPAAEGGRGPAPRPRRPAASETLFIGAAAGRHRRQAAEDRARFRNRAHKLVDRAGLRVGGVLSDIFGKNGRRA